MSEELKPCPFCGGEAKHNDGGSSVYGRFWWAVWCDECQIQVRDREAWKDDGDRMILDLPAKECFGRWNRRADESAVLLEALKNLRSEVSSTGVFADWPDLGKQVDDAIATAEGRASLSSTEGTEG